jgi:signal transduction histidine kinase
VARGELHRLPIDLAILSREIMNELAQNMPQRKVDFIAPGSLSVYADPVYMRIVLTNLLTNAWKFTGRKNDARIELGELTENSTRIIYIRDNGAGFDMQYVDKLFGAFQRLHGSTEFEGTGIGLAIVQRIIRRHGGKIWGEGFIDQGATFYFTLSAGNETLLGVENG